MKIRGVLLLVLPLLLASCAKQVDLPAVKANYAAVKANYAAAKPTLTNLADASFAPLAFPSKTDVEIGEQTPAFDFGAEGISHFSAFELPKTDAPYTVSVASIARNYDCPPCRRAFFYQKIMVLDAAKKPIARKLVRGPIYGKTNIFSDDLNTRELWINVTPDMGARYIIVYTTRELIQNGDQHMETVGEGVVPLGTEGYLVLEGQPENLHNAGMPVGSLTVKVKETGH